MKRHGNLWDILVSKNNFETALNNAIRGKSARRYVKRFMKNPTRNLEKIRQDVINKKFHTAIYHSKEIYEPKPRKLYIARLDERFFHWACMILTEKITLKSESNRFGQYYM